MNPEKNIFAKLAELFKQKTLPPQEVAFHAARPDTRKPEKSVVENKKISQSEGPKPELGEKVIREAIVEAGVAAGRPLTAHEKISAILSGEFKDITGIDNKAVFGGVSRLEHEVDWNDPSAEGWTRVRGILDRMPTDNLSDGDRLVVREVRQAAYEWYWRNSDALNRAQVYESDVRDTFKADFDDFKDRRWVDENQIHQRIDSEKTTATSEHEKNTPEWARDVAEQIISLEKTDIHAPKIEITVSVDQAQEEWERVKGDEKYNWILDEGEQLRDQTVAQVVHDLISNPDLADNKEFLLVKANQLKLAEDLHDTGESMQQFNKVRNKFNNRVYEEFEMDDLDPNRLHQVDLATRDVGSTIGARPVEKAVSTSPPDSQDYMNDLAKEMVKSRKVAPDVVPARGAATLKAVNSRIADAIDKKEHRWLFDKKEPLVLKDKRVGQMVHDILTGPNAVVESKEALLVRGNQLKQILEEKGPGAERVVLEKLLARMRGHTLAAFEREGFARGSREHKKVTRLLGGEVERGSSVAAGAVGPHEWSPVEDPIPAGAEYTDLRKLVTDYSRDVRELTEKLKALGKPTKETHAKFNELQEELNSKIINMLVTKIPNLTPEEAVHVRNLYAKLEDYRQALVKQRMEQGRGYNSLYVPEGKTRAYQLNALLEVREEQDRYNRSRRLLPNRLQEASDQSLRMNIQYLQSEQYRTDVKELFADKANWPDIEFHSGVSVDPENIQNHPFYQRVDDDAIYDRFRQKVTDALTFPDLLEKDYTSWQLGRLEDIGTGMSGFGEPGIIAILSNRAFNVDSFDVLETLYGNMTGPDGEPVVASGPVQEKVLEDAVNYLDSHRNLIEQKFKDEYGPHAVLTRKHIEASVEEVHMLMALTGERAKACRRVLTQVEGSGKGINPAMFAGEASGDNKINQAIEPMKQFFIRWKVASAVQRVWMEDISRLKAWTYGIDTKWEEIINGLDEHGPKYNELVKHAFTILEHEDPPSVKEDIGKDAKIIKEHNDAREHIKGQLSVLQYGLDGKEIQFPPEKISDIKKDQLLRWLIIRDGMSLADPALTGGYTSFEAGWNMGEQIRSYDELFSGDHGVGSLERLRMQTGGLFDITKDHHALEHARKDLEGGALTEAGHYMPSYILRALHTQKNALAEKFIADNFDRYDIFHDSKPGMAALNLEGSVSAERPDLFYKRYELTLTMVNRGLADWEDRTNKPLMGLDRDHPDRLRQKGLPSVDWSKGKIDDARQLAVVTQRCLALGVDPNEFIKISKELSNFALRKDVLKEASHPLVAKSFMDVRKKDARLYRIDEGPKVWADVPPPPDGTPESIKTISEFIRHRYIGRWSSRIANVRGFGASGGLPRWIGDQMNSRSVLVSDLIPISKSRSAKEFEQHGDKYVNTIVNTGGDTARIDVSHTLTMANIMGNRIDFWRDAIGVSDDTITEISRNERVGGKGFQAYTMKDADHIMHLGESLAGVKFHKALPHMDHITEVKTGLKVTLAKWPKFVNKFGHTLGKALPDRITIGKRTFRVNLGKRAEKFFTGELTIDTIWIHRGIAWLGLGGVIGLALAGQNLTKGYSEGSGGGGGSPQHHPAG